MTGLTFADPLPGLGALTEFDLSPVDGAAGLFTLQPAGVPEVKMFLLDAGVYLPEYRPAITDTQASRVGAADPGDLATFVIANHRDGVTTVNLLAPIVANHRTGTCAQVILEGQGYDVKAALPRL